MHFYRPSPNLSPPSCPRHFIFAISLPLSFPYIITVIPRENEVVENLNRGRRNLFCTFHKKCSEEWGSCRGQSVSVSSRWNNNESAQPTDKSHSKINAKNKDTMVISLIFPKSKRSQPCCGFAVRKERFDSNSHLVPSMT